MAKVEAIVGRALRLIHVVDPRQPVQAIDMETGITALNAMCRRWEANGMAIGWNDVSAPDEDMPCPPEAEEAIAFNLAITLAPEYEQMPSPVVIAAATRGLSELRCDVKVANPLSPDRSVRPWGYDTRTDSCP